MILFAQERNPMVDAKLPGQSLETWALGPVPDKDRIHIHALKDSRKGSNEEFDPVLME
jgi:hypothetical protein